MKTRRRFPRAGGDWRFLPVFAVLLSLALSSCKGADPDTDSSLGRIAVSNSWLESCLRDIEGESIEPLRVCPPGTCPGHFDIRPSMVSDLRRCRLLFLFDFQQSMEEKLKTLSGGTMAIVPIVAPEGLCLPSSYLSACEAVAAELNKLDPGNEARRSTALEGIRIRLGELETKLRDQMRSAGLDGVTVVSSGHQDRFCRWLGLDPVARYSGTESASPARILEVLEQGKESEVRFVIANLQEGMQAGEALAAQLSVPTVVFSNFPAMSEVETRFDDLARANLAKLIAASKAAP